MLFHTVKYGIFFILVWTVTWGFLQRRLLPRHAFLLLVSYFFYMSWNAKYALLIAFSTVLDYVTGGLIYRSTVPRRRKILLTVSLVGNLGLLGTFKYFNFFLDNLNQTLQVLGLPGLEAPFRLLLPVGISFYTFQSMSYTLDIYRGRLKPTQNLLDFALFVSFFPQLVAGPIVRARQFLPQLEGPPTYRDEAMTSGIYRILKGLVKKVVIADTLGAFLADPVFAQPTTASGLDALIALCAAFLQLYYDFSAYSDIAIGSARMLGYKLPENFMAPMRATNLEEAWRRWHITLTTWFRDYVYLPLALRHKESKLIPYCAILFTMALMGFWHGASWTFVFFGLYHGIGLGATRFYRRWKQSRKTWSERSSFFFVPWSLRLLIFLFASGSMIFFRATSFSVSQQLFQQILDLRHWFSLQYSFPKLAIVILIASYLLQLVPENFRYQLESKFSKSNAFLQGLFTVVAFSLVDIFMKAAKPFIYFQF